MGLLNFTISVLLVVLSADLIYLWSLDMWKEGILIAIIEIILLGIFTLIGTIGIFLNIRHWLFNRKRKLYRTLIYTHYI